MNALGVLINFSLTRELSLCKTERLTELNGLLQEIARTAVSTGPRGATRFAQGIEALVSIGGEYLAKQIQVSFSPLIYCLFGLI
jgi:aarF domain-containing kinase